MKGLVLAAGKGSRMKELNLQHKSLAVINKKHKRSVLHSGAINMHSTALFAEKIPKR